jgi:hypothetical protein
MNFKHLPKKTAIALAVCSAISQSANAGQSGQHRMYEKGDNYQITDLPAQSQVRKRLENLPESAKKHAMDKLHSFSFPDKDLDSLKIDDNGGVYYSDTEVPQKVNSAPAATSALIALPTVDTFKLHSRPGAAKKVFLDFDGHTVTGTAWNSTVASYSALPFDIDGNPTNFSTDERSRIAEVWHRIAEDYAPFDIDVTTEQPASFGATVARVLFTKDTDANGVAMPSKGAGGVAYVGVWGQSYYATYSPAFVYYNALGPNHPPYMAEAGAHEFGHNLGLSHDGVVDGALNPKCVGTTGYFCGLGSNNVSWGPIMGVGYYTNVTEWSKGEYVSANNTQDDLSIISSQLQYRTDDSSNTFTGATALRVETDGSILTTNPQNDPSNADNANKGIIETRADVDTFWFDAGTGPLNITVAPAWTAFYRASTRGANLDIEAKLYDQFGTQITTSDPIDDSNATLAATVSAGRYYITVAGISNSVTPYSDYGSLGEYFISGSVTPAAIDTTKPNPNPMSWVVPPVAQGKGSITMTATTATDDSGVVLYQFQCVTGGQGCTNSAWQSSPSYTATGLAASTSYSFAVVARDPSNNTTAPSDAINVVTGSNQSPLAMDDAATLNEDGTVTVSVLSNDSDPDSDSLTISSVGVAGHGTVTNNGSSITYKPAANYNGSDSFSYTINDGFGGTATANVMLTVNAVNDAPVLATDTASVVINKTVTINPLGNDTDVDGDVLTLVSITAPSKGKAVKSGNSVIYTAGGSTGTTTFNYTVNDGHGGTATSKITVTITRR